MGRQQCWPNGRSQLKIRHHWHSEALPLWCREFCFCFCFVFLFFHRQLTALKDTTNLETSDSPCSDPLLKTHCQRSKLMAFSLAEKQNFTHPALERRQRCVFRELAPPTIFKSCLDTCLKNVTVRSCVLIRTYYRHWCLSAGFFLWSSN